MKIAENSVVSFHYTLTNGAGELVDTSREGEPLPYLHGANNIVQGLEEALEGKELGDKLQVEVPPHLGYGEYMEEMVQQVDREMFSGIDNLEGNKTSFVAFPNPNNIGEVRFNMEVTVTVRNILGQTVKSAKEVTSLDISDLESGVYLIQSEEGDTIRFIVE